MSLSDEELEEFEFFRFLESLDFGRLGVSGLGVAGLGVAGFGVAGFGVGAFGGAMKIELNKCSKIVSKNFKNCLDSYSSN